MTNGGEREGLGGFVRSIGVEALNRPECNNCNDCFDCSATSSFAVVNGVDEDEEEDRQRGE